MEKLDRYFERCIEDAYKAEEREYKPERVKWFYIVIDNQILFSINTPYSRVTRRAIFRIENNVYKNFGLRNNEDYFFDTVFQPNFVCNLLKVGANYYYLCKYDNNKMEEGEVIPCGKYEKLCKAYYGVSTEEFKEKRNELHLPKRMEWNEYRDTFFKAFGKYPEVTIMDKNKTVEVI